MVREIQDIEQDLNDLETQVDTIAEKLEQIYQDYTETLGDTLKQQLVFSVYQICTQEYPNGFLNLSLSQQQGLQRKIRELAEQAKENLQLGGEVLQKMDFQTDNEESDESDESDENQLLSEQWETFSKDEDNQDLLKELLDSNEQNSNVEAPSETQANSPENLLNWSKLQEDAIAMILENVSSQANETLRKTGILPKEFPKEMIDAALQAEGAGSMSHNAPGVIHLMLELERKNQQQKNENSNDVIQLAIIRLRVGEMEFAAPSLNMKRRELRQLGQQLQQLQEQYNKLTKERAIAQAELAWRSSWQQDDA